MLYLNSLVKGTEGADQVSSGTYELGMSIFLSTPAATAAKLGAKVGTGVGSGLWHTSFRYRQFMLWALQLGLII